ncbi:MAG: hypothetical protein J7M14_05400 [Planctomycetes bacterium]|nr:hypothetical protein [Planctomycetota bacterium]
MQRAGNNTSDSTGTLPGLAKNRFALASKRPWAPLPASSHIHTRDGQFMLPPASSHDKKFFSAICIFRLQASGYSLQTPLAARLAGAHFRTIGAT